jgi:hypothetical protein
VKRLIIGGFPCPASSWEKIFPPTADQRIVPFSEIFAHYDGHFPNLINTCYQIIQDYQPDSLILHDVGVTLGLISVLRAHKKNLPVPAHITLFNGVLRGFNVFKATHPFKMQFISPAQLEAVITAQGSQVDPYFKTHFSEVRKFYRQIIAGTLIGLWKEKMAKQPQPTFDLHNKILILASKKDPYIPYQCIENIQHDFANVQLEELPYRHFPYALADRIYPRVLAFEKT